MKNLIVIIILFTLFQSNVLPQEEWFWQNPLPQGNALFDLSFFDMNSVIISGNSAVLKSSDGGDTWSTKTFIDTDIWYLSISTVGTNLCWALGLNWNTFSNQLIKSNDGGESWQTLSTGSNE
ncbi:MAG: hypothetical protein MUE91_02975 [Ignavibacteriaceae bacterium]|nr:hypothetical protein [Ignavibacteriaceae bacterium]